MIKQHMFVTCNQNESNIKHRVQGVKLKPMILLQHTASTILFWYKALIFVVYCLNHISKNNLSCKISSEVLNDDADDIYPF